MTTISNNQGLHPQNVQPAIQAATAQVQTAQAKAAVEKTASSVSQEFHNFLTDIETLVKSLTSLTGTELEIAKAQFNERLATAKTKLEELRVTVAQQARNTITVTDTYVHEQPWKAVGASAAIGFLLGFILARRN